VGAVIIGNDHHNMIWPRKVSSEETGGKPGQGNREDKFHPSIKIHFLNPVSALAAFNSSRAIQAR
jgi:hypothetical protein